MRITLRSYWFLAVVIMAIGLILELSTMPELQIVGHVLILFGLYLNYQVAAERKRLRRRRAFYERMGQILEERWQAEEVA